MFGDDPDDYSALFGADPAQMGLARAQMLRTRGGLPAAASISTAPGANLPSAQGAPGAPPLAPDVAARLSVLRKQPPASPSPDAASPDSAPQDSALAQPSGPDPGYFGSLGLMASLASGRVAPFAQAATQYANQLQERQGQQLQRLLEQKRNEQLAQYHQDEVQDRQAQIGLQREEMNHGRFRPFIDPTSGRSGILDSWTGQLVNGASTPTGGDPGTPPPSTRAGQNLEKTAERYSDSMNPAKATPDLWKKLQFGARIKPMIQQGLDTGQMNDQMARELASAFASYVSGGGAPAEEQVRALLPPSFTGNLANLSNYLTNDLKGADRTAWLNQLRQSLDREEPVIQGGIRDVLLHNDAGFPAMRSGNLAQTRKTILGGLRKQGYALDEEPPVSGVQQPIRAGQVDLGGTSAPHPQDSAAVTWAKAHPTDPRAAKILAANGGP